MENFIFYYGQYRQVEVLEKRRQGYVVEFRYNFQLLRTVVTKDELLTEKPKTFIKHKPKVDLNNAKCYLERRKRRTLMRLARG